MIKVDTTKNASHKPLFSRKNREKPRRALQKLRKNKASPKTANRRAESASAGLD
jgi:hypothetical protein